VGKRWGVSGRERWGGGGAAGRSIILLTRVRVTFTVTSLHHMELVWVELDLDVDRVSHTVKNLSCLCVVCHPEVYTTDF
jgi:hypothetical protein